LFNCSYCRHFTTQTKQRKTESNYHHFSITSISFTHLVSQFYFGYTKCTSQQQQQQQQQPKFDRMKQRLKDARERLHKRMNFASLFEFIITIIIIIVHSHSIDSIRISISLSLFISFPSFLSQFVLSLSLKNEERKPFLHNFTMTLQ
jgi:Na+/glutamate symporter